MNFEKEMDTKDARLKQLESELAGLREQYSKAFPFTERFLTECAKAGIRKVAIGKAPPSWPFEGSGSVFTFGNARDKSDWPAIWGVVNRLKIGGGCGNTDQHQISAEGQRSLIDGTYKLKDGVWSRVSEEAGG